MRREWIWLAAILLLGALARGAYLQHFETQPDFRAPHVDADFHNYWARGLASGDWTPPRFVENPRIQEIPFFRPPGYPYFLAALYKLFGPGWTAPRIVQLFGLGLLNAFLTYWIARRGFSAATALLAAAGMALSWIAVYFEGEFQEPALSTALLLGMVAGLLRWARERTRPGSLVALVLTGLCLGGLTLIRPNSPLLLLAVVPWCYAALRAAPSSKPAGAASPLARTLRAAGLLVATLVVCVFPSALRNWNVARDWVPVSSNGGINFYIGNNDRADGLVWGEVPGLGTLDTCYDHLEIVRNLEKRLGRPLKHSEVSDYFAQQATAWIAAHPSRFAWLLWRKTALFFGPKEAADNKEVHGERANSVVLRALPVGFPLALAFALPSAVLVALRSRGGRQGQRRNGSAARRNDPADSSSDLGSSDLALSPEALRLWWLAGALIVVWYASYLPFAICSRYRVPLLPLLLFFAAPFALHLVSLARRRRARALVLPLALLALSIVLTHVNWAGYRESFARWHYQRALAWNQQDRLDAAIPEYRAALDENPNYVAVLNDLGAALAQTGRVAEALPYFERYAQARPDRATAHFNLGAAHESLGRREEARVHYERALRADPAHRGARAGLERLGR